MKQFITFAALLSIAQGAQALSPALTMDAIKNYYYVATQPVRRCLYQELFHKTYQGTDIIIMQGDLLHQKTNAVVNAANESLIGAAGVAKAIQDAAGNAEFKQYVLKNIPVDAKGERCPIGQARMTPSFKLQAQYGIKNIIHTVGPRTYTPAQQKLLESSYAESLSLAQNSGLTSITFPAISIGIFGYPLDKAAQAAAQATVAWIKQHPGALKKVVFTIWTDPNAQKYGQQLMHELQQLL